MGPVALILSEILYKNLLWEEYCGKNIMGRIFVGFLLKCDIAWARGERIGPNSYPISTITIVASWPKAKC